MIELVSPGCSLVKQDVQDTAFSHDAIGRYICNTWEEAVDNCGAPFDAIVIGAGMFGAYCAEKIYRFDENDSLRVLVLDAGSVLLTEHIQNLSRIGLDAPAAIKPDPKITRNEVWGLPWESNEAFPGLAYCIGGRSLYWGGWSPRLTTDDLDQWPQQVVEYLLNHYERVEKEIGVHPSTDFITGPLFETLKSELQSIQTEVETVTEVVEAPLAVQGNSPGSGLFSFDKYSSAPILIDAIREDALRIKSFTTEKYRRLFLVPRVHVTNLVIEQGAVRRIKAIVSGTEKSMDIPSSCAVILAASTIESTRLALTSLTDTPDDTLIGHNLMAHLRTDITVRIRKSRFQNLTGVLEPAALLIRGKTELPDGTAYGQFHIQFTAAAVPRDAKNPEKNLFRMIPDIDLLDQTLHNNDPDWVLMTLRGIGEMLGNQSKDKMQKRFIDLDRSVTDEYGRRAWVNMTISGNEEHLWGVMDQTILNLAKKLAGQSEIQYLVKGMWQNTPPAKPDIKRDPLGSTHHEAGTLWMGADPNKSITNLEGRFHDISNAYVAGPALFPTIGSANPSLTALTLARKTASAIVEAARTSAMNQPYLSLFDGTTMNGWQMSGAGRFNLVNGTMISDGGPGILWYSLQMFDDFILKLEWKASAETDNSGVYFRIPALSDMDWTPADRDGYEVQIDDRGINSEQNRTGDPLYQTGAIYKLAPSIKIASHPVTSGKWNAFEIEVKRDLFKVKLNGELVTEYRDVIQRSARGFIGLQNHHPGSRVAFRNIAIKRI